MEKAKAQASDMDDSESEQNDKTTVFIMPKLNKSNDAVKAIDKTQATASKVIEYQPMSLIYFSLLAERTLDFSVFSRMKKGESFDYNKKIEAGKKISSADLDRLLVRSGKELFITETDFLKANAYLNQLFLARFNEPELTLQERIKLNSDSFEILLDLFKYSNFNKYNVEIIKELIKSINIQVAGPNGLQIFFKTMANNKLSYSYVHSYLSYYLFLQVVDHFPWGNDFSKNKLLYLSIFHDLSLHSDRLIKLHHNFFNESKNMTEEEKEMVMSHADSTAMILENIVKAPHELTGLIREHHGIKNGKGMSNTLGITISPTAMAFIVIEDFVTNYFSALEKMSEDKSSGLKREGLELLFATLKKKYERLTYADVLTQLQKYFAKS